MRIKNLLNEKKFASSGTLTCIFSVNSCCATTYTKTQSHYNKSITKLKKLDNVKIGNLKRKNRDHKIILKQDEDTGNLQILLHLRFLFWLHGIAFATELHINTATVKIGILNVIKFASYRYLHLV